MPAITSETSAVLLPYATTTTTTVRAATTLLLPATSATPLAVINASSGSIAPYPDPLERRLQLDTASGGVVGGGVGGWLPALPRLAPIVLSNLLPTYNGSQTTRAALTTTTTATAIASSSSTFPTFRPPSIENLVASSAEDLSNFRDVSFDIFDEDDDLFGSPLAFDASENGLWNGRFVPPPPRPPFFVDEPVLSDGLTTCDLCSWAMPTKSTFIFEGTIEKASELGWPLTLIIVSILSALLGAIIMITVVRCRRKKASNNRNGKCPTSLKVANANPRPNHQHPSHQHLHHHQHHHQHPYQHPQQQQHALHAQFPLHSHHTAYSPHRAASPWQPQQRPQPYTSNSCSSSSLTNDSNSTKRTSLSTIYRPPSYCNALPEQQQQPVALAKVDNCRAPALLLAKGLDMLTRSLPPPPPLHTISNSNDSASDSDSVHDDSSSVCSSHSDERSNQPLYEEPGCTVAADVVASAAVMVAAHSPPAEAD